MISAVRIGLAATQPPYYRGLERLTKRREQLSGGAGGALRTGVYEWYMRIPSTGRARLAAAQWFCWPLLVRAAGVVHMPMPVIQAKIDQVGDTDQGATQRHHHRMRHHRMMERVVQQAQPQQSQTGQ
mgnify:CR=1 FL=1